jgi:hypothetical protein
MALVRAAPRGAARHRSNRRTKMRDDCESAAWAGNHHAFGDAPDSSIDKLAYVVGSIIAHRRAAERRARRIAELGC